MAKTFTYIVKSKPSVILKKIKEMLKPHPEIPFAGDEKSGQMKKWKGFEGSYTMTESSSGTEVSITIAKKPVLIPWITIKSKLNAEAKNW